jgi:hypothetical protein
MIGGLSNKISKSPAKLGLLAGLSALVVFASPIIQAVISSWLSESLKRTPNSFFIQVIKNILSIKLSLLPVLAIFIFICFCCLLLFNLKQKKGNLHISFEEKLSEFIFDLFESRLDDDLIGIVEKALKDKGQDSQPLVTRIIQGLEGSRYFGTDISLISVFRPNELKNYLIITNCVPGLSKGLKKCVEQPIGVDRIPGLRTGLAGTTYLEGTKSKERILLKIFFKEDQHGNMKPYYVDMNNPNQLQAEPFTEYMNLGQLHELLDPKSIAAVTLARAKNPEVPLGVMCVNSSEKETFISSTYDDKLGRAARCLSIAIEIQDLLEELNY